MPWELRRELEICLKHIRNSEPIIKADDGMFLFALVISKENIFLFVNSGKHGWGRGEMLPILKQAKSHAQNKRGFPLHPIKKLHSLKNVCHI